MDNFDWMDWHDFATPHVPEHTHQSLMRYFLHGISPGSCVTAILAGDLYAAANKADPDNTRELAGIARWIMRNAPSMSYGSYEIVESWIAGNEYRDKFEKSVMWHRLTKE